jgi:ribosome-associated translation inhibitor RaiA
MRLQVSSQSGPISPELRALIKRQVGFALGRFEQRIRAVRVRLSDLNGPKGGIDKRCHILATLQDGGTVVAEVDDVEFEPVIHRALDRIARRVQRHGETAQTRSRAASTARKNTTGIGS